MTYNVFGATLNLTQLQQLPLKAGGVQGQAAKPF